MTEINLEPVRVAPEVPESSLIEQDFELSAGDRMRLNSVSFDDPTSAYYGTNARLHMLACEKAAARLGWVNGQPPLPEIAPVLAAANRIKGVAKYTDLTLSEGLSQSTGNQVFFKREDTQPTRAFKIRGAYAKMSNLTDEEKAAGVITVSAGNHALGVALSAKKLGVEASVVVPDTTPAVKIAAIQKLGAKLIRYGADFSESFDYYERELASQGEVLIHPFDDEEIIAGQATIGKEILEQLENPDYIFVPVGGGGLVAGVASYVKNVSPKTRVIGVQSSDSAAMARSLEAGTIEELTEVGTFSDGTAVRKVGELTFKLAQKYVDDVVLVSHAEQAAAMSDFYRDTFRLLEPAGALAIAGAKRLRRQRVTGQKVVVICSGANVDFEKLGQAAELARSV